jgi:hypothetical protein
MKVHLRSFLNKTKKLNKLRMSLKDTRGLFVDQMIVENCVA